MDGLPSGSTILDALDFAHRHPRGSPEFLHAAMRGILPGVRRVVFGGYNQDVDTATVPEDVWYGGGAIPRPSGNESWEIVSASANDAAAGTGARTVSLTTLDVNYAETTQTVSLNGTTAVAIPGNCRFINAGRVLTAGSLGEQQGDITIRVAGGGATRAMMAAPDGFLNQAKYTVPAGYSIELHSAVLGVRSLLGAETATLSLRLTNSAGVSTTAVRFPLFVAGVNLYRHEIAGGMVPFNRQAEKTEVTVRCSVVTQNNTVLDASVLGFLYQTSIWP